MAISRSPEQPRLTVKEIKQSLALALWALAVAVTHGASQEIEHRVLARLNPNQATEDFQAISPVIIELPVVATNTPEPIKSPTPTVTPKPTETRKPVATKTATKPATKPATKIVKKAPETPTPTATKPANPNQYTMKPDQTLDIHYILPPGRHIWLCGSDMNIDQEYLITEVYSPEKLDRNGNIGNDQKPVGSGNRPFPPVNLTECKIFYTGSTGAGGPHVIRLRNLSPLDAMFNMVIRDVESNGCQGKNLKKLPENINGGLVWSSCS